MYAVELSSHDPQGVTRGQFFSSSDLGSVAAYWSIPSVGVSYSNYEYQIIHLNRCGWCGGLGGWVVFWGAGVVV